MTEQERVRRLAELSEKYREKRGTAAENAAWLIALLAIFCCVPVIFARGFAGVQTVICAAGLAAFLVLAAAGQSRKKRFAGERREFYSLLSDELETCFPACAPAMGAEPADGLFDAPLDYGFFDREKRVEGMSLAGTLTVSWPDASAAGYVHAETYEYEEEVGPADENGRKRKETVFRIGQGLVWKIRTEMPVTPGAAVKITRQRKSLGGDFVKQFLPAGKNRDVAVEDPEFSRRFRVQSGDAGFASGYLTLERMRQLAILRDYAGEMGVYIKGDQITVAFSDFQLMGTEQARACGIGGVSAASLDALREQVRQITGALPVLWRA